MCLHLVAFCIFTVDVCKAAVHRNAGLLSLSRTL